MKRVVLALFGFSLLMASAFGESIETEFSTGTNHSSNFDPALMLRTSPRTGTGSAELVTDERSEVRGSRPSVAYTVFRINSRYGDASIQPVLGRINGAQIRVEF